MLNNHCPDLSAQCDVCDKRFKHEDNFRIHILSCHKVAEQLGEQSSAEHTTTRLNCEACESYFESNEQLQEHTKDHARDNALNTCQECDVLVKEN